MRGGVLLLILICSVAAHAQHNRCGTESPSSPAFEQWMQNKLLEASDLRLRTLSATYEVPVVVHIFHRGEPIGTGTNLSEERIRAQIDSLNSDFRRLNADTINTPTEFQSIAADIEIEFVLARQDPMGNPSNGIVRVLGEQSSYLPNDRTDQLSLRAQSMWHPQDYFNIYVGDMQGFLGLAIFPESGLEGTPLEFDKFYIDGVFVDYEYFGVNPSAPAFESYGRTLTHEVGHFLGLLHIWGDGNCSVDDFVADTPTADDDNDGLGSPCAWPNPDDDEVCVPSEPEMFQNYMDYTNDICMNLFTEGQKSRMTTVIENSPRRASLTSSSGLTDPSTFMNDMAATAILNPLEATCGTTIIPSVIVANYGVNEVTTFDIQLFINGNPIGTTTNVVSTLARHATDTIIFAPQAISTVPTDVTFEITSVNGVTDGDLSNNVIDRTIEYTSTQNLPFSEDMESSLALLGAFGSGQPWAVANAPKESPSNNALIFKAHNNTSWFGEPTVLKTPIFDLTGLPSGELLFSYAHSNREDQFYDGLLVKASVDCGETFPFTLFSSFGPDLATTVSTDSYFTPSNQLEWIDTVLSITDYRDIDGVQFAFMGLNGGGNNIYIDNIQIIETNLFENDIRPTSLSSPLITCAASSKINLRIRNVGSEVISSFSIEYYLNDDTLNTSFEGLDIKSKEYQSFELAANDLLEGNNSFGAKVILVNGVADESGIENSIEIDLVRDAREDEYPLTVDFESSDKWAIATEGQDTLFKRTTINNNRVLKAEGFNTTDLGIKNWFISPKLNTGGLDSAGLFFRVAYASRDGFNDRLEVLLSTDCGESYPTSDRLLDANSDSLAVTTSTQPWEPKTNFQWKEYHLDLSQSFFFNEEIRIAFVFTPGGGNNLYIDDISIRANDPPSYEDVMRVFPNPATDRFNVGLNLPQKEPVTLRLHDISGRIVIEEYIENAFNQILEYNTDGLNGLYFLTINGQRYKAIQKLFINH